MRIDELIATSFKGEAPRRFKSRSTVSSTLVKLGHVEADPHDFCNIAITVSARNVETAASKALRELDLLRGVLCLASNPQIETIITGSEHKPVNVIRTGSFHTIHIADGTATEGQVWYEPGYVRARVYRPKDPSKLLAHTRALLRALRNEKYGGTIRDALVRYARAFDEKDPDVAFTKAWSSLESLLSPTRADYNCLMSRCLFLYKDKKYHAAILKQLIQHRNSSVHKVADSTLSRIYCYRLQQYLRDTIHFLLANQKFFKDIDEALLFLDSPSSANALERRIALAKRAHHFVTAG